MFKQEDYSVVLHTEEGAGEGFLPNNISYDIISSGDLAAILPTLDSDTERKLLSGVTLSEITQDETMDVTKYYVQPSPVWPRGPPDRVPFSGELNFQVEISSCDVHRKKYLYSHKLNRIYVDMRVPFPVSFRWNTNTANETGTLFVRSTVVFSEESQAEKRVERCTQHTHENTGDTNLTIIKNVLHSSREKNTQGVYYCGQPEHADSWYSVLVEFPGGPGTHAYQFGCKNSCPNGINRRAIDIIFSLEDMNGHVYGRQIVGARVCACPKRDMHKDEEEVGRVGKRKVEKGGETKIKKVKIDEAGMVSLKNDQEPFTLPPLTINGSRAIIAGLEMMLHIMETAAAYTQNDPQAAERCLNIARLKQYIDGFKKTKSHL